MATEHKLLLSSLRYSTSPSPVNSKQPSSSRIHLDPELQDSLTKLDDAISYTDVVAGIIDPTSDPRNTCKMLSPRVVEDGYELKHGLLSNMDSNVQLMNFMGNSTLHSLNLKESSSNPIGDPILCTGAPENVSNGETDSHAQVVPNAIEDIEKFHFRANDLVSKFHLSLRSHILSGPERYNSDKVLELMQLYQDMCKSNFENAHKSQGGSYSFSDMPFNDERLTQEVNTWKLVRFLHPGSQYDSSSTRNMETNESNQFCYSSEKRVVEDLMQRDPNVRCYTSVVQWLEDIHCCELDEHPLRAKCISRNICFDNTLLLLRDYANRGKPLNSNIISEIDLDAPLRQRKTLSDLDQKDELMLSQCIWHQIRAGRVQEAQCILKSVGQPMKASIFEGIKYYHDPNIETEPDDLSNPVAIEGNQNRRISKYILWNMSEESRFNVFDRAIYGVLSGNLQAILPVCKLWSDWLWANYTVMLDVYFENGIRNKSHYRRGKVPIDLPSAYWQQHLEPEIIFNELLANSDENLSKYANSKFGIIQFYLLTNQFEELIDTLHGWILTIDDPFSNLDLHILRFITHLVVYLRHIELALCEEKCDAVIERYITELINLEYYEMVSTYVASLSDASRQIQCYSRLLHTVDDVAVQMRCLNAAKEVGLNVRYIIRQIIQDVREKNMVYHVQHDIFVRSNSLSYDDVKSMQVMDWLLYDESQIQESLTQGLVLIRLFLSRNNYMAASKTFEKLPKNILHRVLDFWKRSKGNIATPPEIENDIKEHICYSAYFAAREAFDMWFTFFYQKRPKSPEYTPAHFSHGGVSEDKVFEFSTDMITWHELMEAYQFSAKSKIESVLLFEGGWLVDRYPLSNCDSERWRQQDSIRKIHIPKLCFLLYSLLKDCGHYQNCLRISNVIACEDYKLYQLFSTQEFKELLSMMKEASTLLSERKEVDYLGYPL